MAVERQGGVFISSIVFFVMTYPIEKLAELCAACNADADQYLYETHQIRRHMTVEEAQAICEQYS